MRVNILFGGKAGQGANVLTEVMGKALVKQGYYVFYSRDYQSLIRGGHNFNVLTFSEVPVHSNDKAIDILVQLDENTTKIHKKDLKKNGISLVGHTENMYYAGALFKIFGLDFRILETELKALGKKFEENIQEATKGWEDTKTNMQITKVEGKKIRFLDGSQAIADSAIKSGLDIYYAYPMTPATTVLSELAGKQIANNFLTLQLENEISVINAAIGSAITGARAMIGTSGGGFDLMTESLSLAGMIDIPLVIYLSQRPGPATGVATYTAQEDLNTARCSGHGDFPRLLVAPGDIKESEELTNQAFYFAEKYKIPSIIINDKHLGESYYTETESPTMLKIKKLTPLARHSGNETDKDGLTTSDPEIVKKNVDERMAKIELMEKDMKKFETFKIYGNKNSKNLIVFWGSTKGAIIDAMGNLDCRALQILYLEPFPTEIKNELLKAQNLILVENNKKGQLGELIAEKTGIFFNDKNKILKYDGRAFDCDELQKEIKGMLK
ncbi:2-oxoacid:acceptor oxidoreductase family protein [Candidatus Pacearchaeota archaeon]|nr:2-oxoacid:acceptor oxidoreductase family protein [Candidatus Pacearchaeota archaeon]